MNPHLNVHSSISFVRDQDYASGTFAVTSRIVSDHLLNPVSMKAMRTVSRFSLAKLISTEKRMLLGLTSVGCTNGDLENFGFKSARAILGRTRLFPFFASIPACDMDILEGYDCLI
jgi:hypothetical protein